MTKCHAALVTVSILALFETLQGPFNDLVLHARVQLGEEGAETGYPNHKVAVVFRMFLCIPQDVGIKDIELNVIAIIVEIGLDQIQTLSLPLRVFN